MNLLELVQAVCLEVGVQSPTIVVTSRDTQILQLLAIANRLGLDLGRVFEWEAQDKEYILTTVATTTTGTVTAGSAVITGIPSTTGLSSAYGVTGTGIAPFAQIVTVDSGTQVTMTMPATASATQALTFSKVQYPLPTDWLKQVPQTEWDRSNRWPLMGPQSSQDWQSFKSGIVMAGPRLRFRIQGQSITLNPPPANGVTLAFEYISNAWVANGTKTKFTADTDTCYFDDSLMISGLKLRWLQTKGFDYTYAMAEYKEILSNCMAQNKSAPKLSLAPSQGSVLLTNQNIPDGNWRS